MNDKHDCPACGKPLTPAGELNGPLIWLLCPDGHLAYGEVDRDPEPEKPGGRHKRGVARPRTTPAGRR